MSASPMTSGGRFERRELEIPAGKTVAIVGPTGGGKIHHRAPHVPVLRPASGAIAIDGQDLRDVTQNSLRRAIGVVPQDTVLFNDSIRYNIAYGDVTPSRPRSRTRHGARSSPISSPSFPTASLRAWASVG